MDVTRLPPERLAQIVKYLKPESVGVIDVWHDGHTWKIQASKSLEDDGFVQRVRNVLVNS